MLYSVFRDIGICRDRRPIENATETTPITVPETESIGARGDGGYSHSTQYVKQ